MKRRFKKTLLPAVMALIMMAIVLFPVSKVYAESGYSVTYYNLKNPINDKNTLISDNGKVKSAYLDEPLAPNTADYRNFESIGYKFKADDYQLFKDEKLRAVGWSTEKYVTADNQLVDFNAPINTAKANYLGEVNVYAIWQYKVTFANEDTTNLSSQFVYEHATVKPLSTPPTKSGYTLVGWTKDLSTKELYDFKSQVTTAFTLYPVFKPTQPNPATKVRYSVAYYKDKIDDNNLIATVQGGEYNTNYQLTKNDVQTDLGKDWLNAKKPVGYVSGIMKTSYPKLASGTNNVIKVVYQKANNAYVLHYDANTTDSTSDVPADKAYAAKTTVTVADKITRDGYTFKGWNTQADGKGTMYAPGDRFQMTDSDTTLYATWQKGPETGDYTLAFLYGVTGLGSAALIVFLSLRKKFKKA